MNKILNSFKKIFTFTIVIIAILNVTGCGGNFGDARKSSPDPRERVQKNIEEGKGFTFSDGFGGSKGTNYEFASSNPLWRASLDVVDFMPLATANYSGGIIVTDWYSKSNSPEESVKISIRFLTNEIRSDSLSIRVFYKNCDSNSGSCVVNEDSGKLNNELTSEILKTAALYSNNDIKENKRTYIMSPDLDGARGGN